MSYEKYYPGGWQSGESGGTPITPDALNHMEDGIANSAPAGYGLGTNTVNASTIQSMNNNGFYHGAITEPATGYSGNTYGEHIQYSDNYAYQRLIGMHASTGITPGTVRRRYKDNGTWSEIEYVNPPMILGKEYRTVERYLGKPVYAKVMDFGALPASASKKVDVGSNMTALVRYSLIGSNDNSTFNGFPGIESVYSNNREIIIATKADLSAYSVYAELWYTKD